MTYTRPSQTKAIYIYILMALFLCFEMALQVSPGVMTEELTTSLQVDSFGLGLMSSIYFYTYTGMQIPSGLMYDRSNFRMLVCMAIFICALGATFFSFSTSLITGSVSRAFMGFGSAFAFMSVLIVADRFFEEKYFAMLAGIAQLLAAIGGMAGALPIRWLVEAYSWQTAIMIFAIVGYVLGVLTWFSLSKPKEAQNVSHEKEPVTTSLSTILKNKQTWFLGAYVFLNWAPVTAFASLWGVPFLTQAHHFTHEEAALLCALMWLGIGLASPLVGAASDYIKRRNTFLILMSIIGASSLLAVIWLNTLPFYAIAVLIFLGGAGSSGQILTFAVIKDFTSSKRISTAIGVNNMAMVASGIVMQPLFGYLIARNSFSDDLPLAADFKVIMLIVPALHILGMLTVILGIKETFCRPAASR